ncbi:MAG: hypothetical protein AAGI54_00775 [Planctomycetota bacterium]
MTPPAPDLDHDLARHRVDQAFQQLPKSARLAFLLAQDPDLTTGEAAAVLDTTPQRLTHTAEAVRRHLLGVARRAMNQHRPDPHRPA